MDLDKGMAETVAPEMPSAAEIAACRWLPDEELACTARSTARTGFQGGLQWYRARTASRSTPPSCRLFAGRTIDVPSCFIAGKSDWGVYQRPARSRRCGRPPARRCADVHLIDGAGHWVQQEQPEAVTNLLVSFLRG